MSVKRELTVVPNLYTRVLTIIFTTKRFCFLSREFKENATLKELPLPAPFTQKEIACIKDIAQSLGLSVECAKKTNVRKILALCVTSLIA